MMTNAAEIRHNWGEGNVLWILCQGHRGNSEKPAVEKEVAGRHGEC